MVIEIMTKKVSPEPDTLGSVLSAAIQALKLNQTTFADRVGISRAGLNSILRGHKSGTTTIPELLPHLPEEWRTRVIVAWLHDTPPSEYRHLVSVTPRESSGRSKVDLRAALLRAGVPTFDDRRHSLLEW